MSTDAQFPRPLEPVDYAKLIDRDDPGGAPAALDDEDIYNLIEGGRAERARENYCYWGLLPHRG